LGFLVECAPGICKSYGENSSAVEVLKDKLGDYHILVTEIRWHHQTDVHFIY
jgi:hypothetical protein